MRKYPNVKTKFARVERPISFIVVKFSDEYDHNVVKSECVQDPMNELITIDNTSNVYYNSLNAAINEGINRAKNELIAIVHEDVVLPEKWQQSFEESLSSLEEKDHTWGVLGAVGWDHDNSIVGHWSDPRNYRNTFGSQRYQIVKEIDPQIMILNKNRDIPLDVNFPGIHNIGIDIPLTAKINGFNTYVVDAPTIHKYADENGKLVLGMSNSRKIVDRKSLAFRADRACCDIYFLEKWPKEKLKTFTLDNTSIGEVDTNVRKLLKEPIILVSKGGGGSRLLSLLLKDLGLFIGNELNNSYDSLEMVMPLYTSMFIKYKCDTEWKNERIVQLLQSGALNMIKGINTEIVRWGFKLPENLFLLDEISQAFPNASYVHLIRDPLHTCLRRTHQTARLDNQIGRLTLPLAYDFVERERGLIFDDSEVERSAYTIIHQLSIIDDFFCSKQKKSWIQLSFEDVIKRPNEETARVGDWLNLFPVDNQLSNVTDLTRAKANTRDFSYRDCKTVYKLLKEIRKKFGYNS